MSPQKVVSCVALFAALAALFAGGCTVLPDKPSGTPSQALSDTSDTTLGRLAAGVASAAASTAQPKGEAASASTNALPLPAPPSALCILDHGQEAFAARVALIDLAERSVDVQTFAWAGDRVGRLLAERLLRTAERGVRVRVLLDDVDAAGRDFSIGLFDAYPNVEVRLYNPFRVRLITGLGRPLEMVLNMDRLDHRMHNKTFIVDNQAAIVGGRNIADEYYGLNHKFNYRDFDLLALGPAAGQVSECFDAYWADARSYPMRDVKPKEFTPQRLRQERQKLASFAAGKLGAFPWPLPDTRELAMRFIGDALASAVSAPTEMLFDDPRKGKTETKQPSHIRAVLASTPPSSEMLVVNPYFIPQDQLVGTLVQCEKDGVRVRVLTNSLASTDVIAVHAAYSKRRKRLLEAGVTLCELRADAEDRAAQIAPDCPGATLALHGKVVVMDRHRVFIGSMNLDPRSHHLNTEGGFLIDSPELARQVAARLDVELEPRNCWRLGLGGDSITWSTVRNGTPITEHDDDEPDASWWRKAKCGLFKLLPIEGEL